LWGETEVGRHQIGVIGAARCRRKPKSKLQKENDMKRFALSTALVAGLAAPAIASDQLALTLGVEPGAYTTAELIELRRAMEEGDRTRINFILSGEASESTAADRARALEAAALRAEEEGDYRQADFLRGQIDGDDLSVSSRGGAAAPTGAEAAIAAVGIDTDGLSASEIVVLARALEEGDGTRVFGILSRTER
jgi:hypothetical protein